MSRRDPRSMKQRIIALKMENPSRMPAGIAREVGCKRSYAVRILVDMLLTRDCAVIAGELRKKAPDPHTIGSGRRHVSGYTKLM